MKQLVIVGIIGFASVWVAACGAEDRRLRQPVRAHRAPLRWRQGKGRSSARPTNTVRQSAAAESNP